MTTAEFNECVELYTDAVFRFILKNIGRNHDAEDIIQSSFEKMWKKHSDIDAAKAKSYLFTTAYRTMIDQIRKSKFCQDIDPAEMVEQGRINKLPGAADAIEDGLKKLPEIQKSVLMLRDYEGYSYQEIGDIMDLNESQVKVYIFRARTFLKGYFVSIDKVI